jgi:2-oxoglutarate ferredoxin oxidoreductase subunit delta
MNPRPANPQLASTIADSVATGGFREWTSGHAARQPIFPPTMLKLRNVGVVVIDDRCKGCSFCIEFCPKHVLEQSSKLNVRGVHPPQVKHEELCVGCGICEELCPDMAIFLVDKEERE